MTLTVEFDCILNTDWFSQDGTDSATLIESFLKAYDDDVSSHARTTLLKTALLT